MKLLLDTHIWLWAVQSPEKLNRRARREIERLGNEIYVSPVSLWEARHLEQRGRLKPRLNFDVLLDSGLPRAPLREAAFTFEVAVVASRIWLPQSDPGDLFLAATALANDLTLITADEQLLACTWLKTLAAS